MRYDVIVVGGALVGLSSAIALARCGLSIAIVEARETLSPPCPRRDFDARVSALTPFSWRLLRHLGALSHLAHARCMPFRAMHVWDRAGFGELHFDAGDVGLTHLGVVVENQELEWALSQLASADARISWYRPQHVEAIVADGDSVSVYTDAARVQARLVVAADGARSKVRELAGIAVREHDYQQQAVVATLRTSVDHAATAWQHFTATGPVALLPLPQGVSSLVWSTTTANANALVEMSPATFCSALGQAFEHRLGAITSVNARACFALRSVQAERYLAPRVVLLGDAAHTIHPLAGQGVNLGLLDVAALGRAISRLHRRGRDIGLDANLRRYERERRAHNVLMDQTMSAFHRVFTSPMAPLAWMRNAGFAATQRLLPLRRLFIHRASGLSAWPPDVARSPDTLP